jgi:hsp70-interacting protein
MESLLRWSIANSDPNAQRPSPEQLRSLDPGIIDHILGKPDAVLMREATETALDENKSEDERAQALEDLEMVCSTCLYAKYYC